ncbi:MAG TPA: FAD binding domain-containing protein [Kineosporiaceae bacterium]
MTARYLAATTVEEAVAAMAAGARPVAGGTDLVVRARQGSAGLPPALVGIHRLPELSSIDGPDARGLRIGAGVNHETIMSHPAVLTAYTGLADACAIVGSHATRVNGTLGGNVMNASPAMDTGAPLVCHGALAVLHGPREVRRIRLDELWTAPGQSSASPDELLVSIELPPPPGEGGLVTASAYVRLQYRRQMEIAIVGAAATVGVAQGEIQQARIAITALAPTIRRVPMSEEALTGAVVGADGRDPRGAADIETAARLAARAARPVSDVRASAEYRRAMAIVVTRRAVITAVLRATGGRVPVPASDTTFGS